MSRLNELEKKYNELGEEIKRLKSQGEWPTSWSELESVKGYYTNGDSKVCKIDAEWFVDFEDRNIFATKAQAEASIALAQITQLLKAYNGDWLPDFDDTQEYNHVIFYHKNELIISSYHIGSNHLLAFNTEHKARHFLINHEALIQQAKPLL